MRIDEIMTRDVRCVAPDADLKKAAVMMKELDVGVLPICDHDRLAGVVTDRDIVIRGLANGSDPLRLTVSDVMTPSVMWCFEDDQVEDAARIMQDKQIRRLPVLSHDKRLVGIVSLGDLAVRSHRDKLVGETLEEVSQPEHSLA